MTRKLTRLAFAAAALAAASAAPAAAQSDLLLQLRSGSPQGDRFRVDSAGGFAALGTLGIGIIPVSGTGERLFWYPFKGAFRAGSTGGTAVWDDASVGFFSWAGGQGSTASGLATLAFGDGVTASGSSAVALGSSTTASGSGSFASGASSRATGAFSTAVGFTNTASGQGSVALGYRSTANADYAVAIGQRASAAGRSGVFVFADASTTDSIQASANNQFSARAAGGVRFFTNATTTTGVSLNAGGSSWNVVSDRNRKENFLSLDGEDLLWRLRSVPVTTWNYIAEGRRVRHVGPMAQDWHRAFGLNDDDKTINQGDFDGVNLAAIQALEARTSELRARAAEVDQLRAELAATQQRLQALEAIVRELAARQ